MKSNWCKSSLARAVAGGPVASVAIRRVTGGCRSVHSEKAGRECSAPKTFCRCDADAVSLAEGCIWYTGSRGVPGSPGSLVRGMLSKRLPANAGELTISAILKLGMVHPDSNEPGPGSGEDVFRAERMILDVAVSRHQGRPEGAGTDRRAVLEPHSTREGGEPQGSRTRGGHGTHWREGGTEPTYRDIDA
jgi:hypothetical protein